jgi:Uma2 family endonuclease
MSMPEVEMPLVLSPELAGTLMTPEEFDAIDEADADHVYELIHGVLVVSPPPLEMERGPNELLGYLLLLYRQQHALGKALDWTLPENYVKTPGSRRRCDRAIWAGLGRVPRPRQDTPSIVVEFLSAGKRSRRRDYEEKRIEYLAAGVAEYWLFDCFRRVLTVFRTTRRGPTTVVVHEGRSYQTAVLPGFELAVAQVLAVADMFEPAAPDQKALKRKRGKRIGRRPGPAG